MKAVQDEPVQDEPVHEDPQDEWWRRGRSPRHGAPREPVNQRVVLDAAMSLIRAHGLDGLSMRKLAAELGVTTSSIYWWAGTKDELLTLMIDAVMADVKVPRRNTKTSWSVHVREIAVRIYDAWEQHRALIPVVVGGVPVGPNGLRLADAWIRTLLDAGFDADAAVSATAAMTNLVLGSVPGRELGTVATDADPSGQSTSTHRWVDLTDKLGHHSQPMDQYEALVTSAASLQRGANKRMFLFALDALLDGLQLTLDRQGPL